MNDKGPREVRLRYPATRFKNLKKALKELEPFFRDGRQIQSGRPLREFGGLRPRELVANWLLCVAFNEHCESPDRLTFFSDPLGGDGILYDTKTDEPFPTEHVLVPNQMGKVANIEALILKAIDDKRNKGGAAYASGKTLVVFLNAGGGSWFPNKVAKQLPDPLYYAVVWVVGLEAGEYDYSVTQLDVGECDAPTWLIRIASNFDSWAVDRVQ
jgi:hypothetical protein